MQSNYNEPWDSIAKRTVDDEYKLDSLIAAQPVETWESPVYGFLVSNKEIVITQDVLEDTDYFKAPWES